MYVECTAHASRMPSSTDQDLAPVHHCQGDRDESVRQFLVQSGIPLLATPGHDRINAHGLLSNLPGAIA